MKTHPRKRTRTNTKMAARAARAAQKRAETRTTVKLTPAQLTAIIAAVLLLSFSLAMITIGASKATVQTTTDTSLQTAQPITTPSDGIVVAQQQSLSVPRIDIWYDYACSHCYELHNTFAKSLEDAALAGHIDVRYHPVAILGAEFSAQGAAAENWAATTNPDTYLAYRTALHEQLVTPLVTGERDDSPTADEFISIAKTLNMTDIDKLETILAGDDQSAFNSIVYETQAFVDAGYTGTPTVVINGTTSQNWPNDVAELLMSIE